MLQVAPDEIVRGQTGGQSDIRLDILNPVVEYNLGWADLLGTYSYTTSKATSSANFGWQGFNVWELSVPQRA